MKTLTTLLVIAFVFISNSSFSQVKSTFENASLTASADGTQTVQLDWRKGAENTAYYLVERSTDGKEFKQVALVFTWEDSQYTAYKYRDKGFSAPGHALYYRIVIVNDQKELSYLPVRRVESSTAELSTVSPVAADAIARCK